MRQIPAVPMVYIKRAVMIMEPPNPATLARRDALEREKLGGLEGLHKRKSEGDGEQSSKKKKKGPKEPNPLSVKKRKKSDGQDSLTLDAAENEEKSEESNIVGKVTEGIRRSKPSRHRRRHKNLEESPDENISAEIAS